MLFLEILNSDPCVFKTAKINVITLGDFPLQISTLKKEKLIRGKPGKRHLTEIAYA